MGITEDQRRRRRKRLGSSDSPAVVGVNPWRNAGDVYIEKTQDLADTLESEALAIGNDFEAPLLAWAARELGVEIQPNVEVVPLFDDVMAANLDALVVGKPQAMEAKTGTGAEYGRPETDEVPERVLVQTHHIMFVKELELVWVPVLVAKFDRLSREMYKVTRNERLIEVIVERDHAFWENHVLPRVPPADLLPSLDVLRRVRRVPEKLAEVDPALVAEWRRLRAARIVALAEEGLAQAALVAALGDAEGADFGDPRKILTFRGYSYEQIDGKRLKLADPETWKMYAKTIDVSPSLKEVNK